MGKVMFCKKCGWVGGVLFGKKCSFCGTKMETLSEDMKQKYNIFNENWSKLYSELHMLNTPDGAKRRIEELLSRKNSFIMNEVSSNSLFSIEDCKRQVENNKKGYYETVEYHNKQIGEQQAKNLAQMQKEKDKQNFIPKCPICGSTNIRKIGLLNRAISTELWGLGSKKIGKQFHCNNCGADF